MEARVEASGGPVGKREVGLGRRSFPGSCFALRCQAGLLRALDLGDAAAMDDKLNHAVVQALDFGAHEGHPLGFIGSLGMLGGGFRGHRRAQLDGFIFII